MNTDVVWYCTCGCLTGDGQGDVLADDSDLSLSSGSSTELIRMFRAVSRRRLCTGLDGAKIASQKQNKKTLTSNWRTKNVYMHVHNS